MKVVIVFAVAACIAGLYAAPVTHAVDWPAVSALLDETYYTITEALLHIKTLVNDSNPAVGSNLSSLLDGALVKVRAHFEVAKAKCEAHTLTVSDAETLFSQLKDILLGVQQNLQDVLPLLPPGIAPHVVNFFYAAYAKAEHNVQQIYALLGQ